MRTDGNPCQFFLLLTLVMWCMCLAESGAFCHRTKPHTHLAQELEKLEGPGEGGAIAGSVAASCQLVEPAYKWQCVSVTKWLIIPSPTPNLLQGSLLWPTLTGHPGKGILENAVLLSFTHFKATTASQFLSTSIQLKSSHIISEMLSSINSVCTSYKNR